MSCRTIHTMHLKEHLNGHITIPHTVHTTHSRYHTNHLTMPHIIPSYCTSHHTHTSYTVLYCTNCIVITTLLPPLLHLLSSISSLLLLLPYPRCEVFDFRSLEVLVLDEADTLLAMGFRENISQILAFLPKQRRYVCLWVVVE